VCYLWANPACVGVAPEDRVQQGSSTLTPNECVAQGWCYDSSAEPTCFTRA
jgi:hypothetical protein